MKRYIISSAILVLALSIHAQNTKPGSTGNSSGTAVKEKKTSEEVGKAEAPKQRQAERRVSSSNQGTNPAVRTNPGSNARSSSAGNERRSQSYGNQERGRETVITREREVRTRTNQGTIPANNRYNENPGNASVRGQRPGVQGNNGVRDRGASSNRPSSATVTRTRESTTISSREYVPRNEKEYATKRRTYTSPERRVVVRTIPNTRYVPRPVEYRRSYYPYRVPPRVEIIWTVSLYNQYRYLYPDYHYWYYPVGYRIHTVSAYDADRYIGEFARIYGRVHETWYNIETDQYFLYFGEPYPYQDFTVIINGRDARRYSRRPERYFSGRHIAVTGIVSVFEGKPEMMIKKRNQIDLYF